MIKVSNSISSLAEDISLDLTPLLDIVFILLIFFMLTSGNIVQRLTMTLPENAQKALPNMTTKNHIILEVGKNNYAFDGVVFSKFHQLDTIIKNKNWQKNKLVIASDKNISVEKLLEVLTYLQQNGIKNTNILMKNKNNKK